MAAISDAITEADDRWDGGNVSWDLIDSRYEVGRALGKGPYAEVLEVTHKITREVFAVKVLINKSNPTPPETSCLQDVAKPGPCSEHIVHAFDHWLTTDSRLLISQTFIKLQRCDGTLEDYLAELQHNRCHIGFLDVIEIMIQILSGVCHCHKRNVGYRDLSESNTLYIKEPCSCHTLHHSKLRWLIADFQFSTMNLNKDAFVMSHERRGPPAYKAPELIRLNGSYCRHSDSWSVGCILFKVATTGGRVAFPSDFDVASFILKPDVEYPKLKADDNVNLQQGFECPIRGHPVPLWGQINAILGICFTREPEQRATAFHLKKTFERIWDICSQITTKQNE